MCVCERELGTNIRFDNDVVVLFTQYSFRVVRSFYTIPGMHEIFLWMTCIILLSFFAVRR